MEVAAIAAQSRCSSGLSNYCENFVDNLLLRISIEKKSTSPIPIKREQTPYHDKTPPLTPDELEVAPIAAQSRCSSGLSVYCENFVDNLLLRISIEKKSTSPIPIKREQTPYHVKTPPLTPDELEVAPIAQSFSRCSSGLSNYCENVVEKLLLRISLEKEKTPPLTPDELEVAPIAAQSYSRSSSGLSNYCENVVDKLLLRISLEKEKTPPLTPDELEVAPIAAQSYSRSSSGLSNYCENFVEKLLLRISIEKESTSPIPIKREQTPYHEKTPSLTPDELEVAAIAAQSRCSSGLSDYCENFVEKLLLRISLEKKSTSPIPIKREQTPYHEKTPSLTPDELEFAPIAQSFSRCSSGLSNYCETLVDGLLFRISIEKEPTPVPRKQTPYPDEERVSSTASPIESEPTLVYLTINIPESPLQVYIKCAFCLCMKFYTVVGMLIWLRSTVLHASFLVDYRLNVLKIIAIAHIMR